MKVRLSHSHGQVSVGRCSGPSTPKATRICMATMNILGEEDRFELVCRYTRTRKVFSRGYRSGMSSHDFRKRRDPANVFFREGKPQRWQFVAVAGSCRNLDVFSGLAQLR